MAEPLKNQFGRDVPRRIADSIAVAYGVFPSQAFMRQALRGYDDLELMPRGRQIAAALHDHLPRGYPEAIGIVVSSLDVLATHVDDQQSLGRFLYMPYCQFVAEYGIEHFDLSMQANYELTQRFTAEFSIRPFLEGYPKQTLALLGRWAHDPSEHVRRLVSEGTRPRLPWASRLPAFQQDPAPVLALLEVLRDDPSLYVRRSVANNLNDIGKDHPQVLVQTARSWMKGASAEREWLVRHALRSAIKRGDAEALAVLGYGGGESIDVSSAKIMPRSPQIGDAVDIAFDVANRTKNTTDIMVDFRIHYVKANGSTSAKVFKLKELRLASGQSARLQKRVGLADLTTRKHYPGRHQVEAMVNGRVQALGFFDLR